MPGCLMAMARVNRPSVMVYGGTIRAGCRPEHADDKLDIISAFEAYGKFTTGKIGYHGSSLIENTFDDTQPYSS